MLYNWNENSTLRFLNEYKNHPCLWNPNHKYYRDKSKKLEALKRIVKRLKLDCLTVEACLQHIETIRKIYIREQGKEIEGLQDCKHYKSKVPWYELFKGMVLEIIKQANSETVNSYICITPSEFAKLTFSPTRNKQKARHKNGSEENKKVTKQNYRISPIKKSRPVETHDVTFYCVHPSSKLLECNQKSKKCRAEKEVDCSAEVCSDNNQVKGQKSTHACRTPLASSVHRKQSLYKTKSDPLLKMQSSKDNYNFKRNLETTTNCPAQRRLAVDFESQSKCPAFGEDCLNRKKSDPKITPCPAYANCSNSISANQNSDVRYVPCSNWNKTYEKDCYSRRFTERDRDYLSSKDNFRSENIYQTRCTSMLNDTNLNFKRNFDTKNYGNLDTRDNYEPRPTTTNKYVNTCECNVVEAYSPLKIIIMDSSKSDAPSIQIESRLQEKSANTTRAALCNKEIQCCDHQLKCSKGTSTDTGLADKEMLPTVRVSSFTVGSKCQCTDVKETELNCLHCCAGCNSSTSGKECDIQDLPLQELTTKLILECLEKIVKSQGKELIQHNTTCTNSNNSNNNSDQKTSAVKNSCTNTAISEEQCCAIIKNKSCCCFEKYLSKVQKDNLELKEIMDTVKTLIISQNETANKTDCDKSNTEKRVTYDSLTLATQTSNFNLGSKDRTHSCSNMSMTTLNEEKEVSASNSLQDVEYITSLERINNLCRCEPEKSGIRYLFETFGQVFDKTEKPTSKDRTRVQPEHCDIVQTRTGVSEKKLRKIKEKNRIYY